MTMSFEDSMHAATFGPALEATDHVEALPDPRVSPPVALVCIVASSALLWWLIWILAAAIL